MLTFMEGTKKKRKISKSYCHSSLRIYAFRSPRVQSAYIYHSGNFLFSLFPYLGARQKKTNELIFTLNVVLFPLKMFLITFFIITT